MEGKAFHPHLIQPGRRESESGGEGAGRPRLLGLWGGALVQPSLRPLPSGYQGALCHPGQSWCFYKFLSGKAISQPDLLPLLEQQIAQENAITRVLCCARRAQRTEGLSLPRDFKAHSQDESLILNTMRLFLEFN